MLVYFIVEHKANFRFFPAYYYHHYYCCRHVYKTSLYNQMTNNERSLWWETRGDEHMQKMLFYVTRIKLEINHDNRNRTNCYWLRWSNQILVWHRSSSISPSIVISIESIYISCTHIYERQGLQIHCIIWPPPYLSHRMHP